jgi:NADPH:quinone reductase-like Zn-dependent oxidoreductase
MNTLAAITLLCVSFVWHAQPTSAPSGPAAATMKAVRVHQPGGVEAMKYEDAPRPTPKEDEILIKVFAAGVNPVDAGLRAGRFGRVTLPFTPGSDVSGIVEAVGSKVTQFNVGDPVYAFLSLGVGGGYAEYAVVSKSQASPKPASLSHEEAAAVPLAASTAWQALIDTAKLEAGQTVLIHGGSGGVGAFAVQIAKARGAKVIATASAANQEFLRQLGADVAIDYASQKFEDLAKDVDVVLDTVGGETQKRSITVLKKGGILVSIVGGPDRAAFEAAGVRGVGILVRPDADTLEELTKLIEAGQLKVFVSQTFPLSEAAKAHEQIATKHTRGKIVLKIAE